MVRRNSPVPSIVYRGEHGAPDGRNFQTRLGSLSFAGREATAYLYATCPNNRLLDACATAPRVITASVEIRRPIVHSSRDPFVDLTPLIEALGHELAARIALGNAACIECTDNWAERIDPDQRFGSVASFLDSEPQRLSELYFNAFCLFDDPAAVAALRERGFDGGVYAGYGDNRDDVEYRVFDERQVQVISSKRVR